MTNSENIICFRIDPELKRILKKIAKDNDEHLSDLVRRAIQTYLEKYEV